METDTAYSQPLQQRLAGLQQSVERLRRTLPVPRQTIQHCLNLLAQSEWSQLHGIIAVDLKVAATPEDRKLLYIFQAAVPLLNRSECAEAGQLAHKLTESCRRALADPLRSPEQPAKCHTVHAQDKPGHELFLELMELVEQIDASFTDIRVANIRYGRGLLQERLEALRDYLDSLGISVEQLRQADLLHWLEMRVNQHFLEGAVGLSSLTPLAERTVSTWNPKELNVDGVAELVEQWRAFSHYFPERSLVLQHSDHTRATLSPEQLRAMLEFAAIKGGLWFRCCDVAAWMCAPEGLLADYLAPLPVVDGRLQLHADLLDALGNADVLTLIARLQRHQAVHSISYGDLVLGHQYVRSLVTAATAGESMSAAEFRGYLEYRWPGIPGWARRPHPLYSRYRHGVFTPLYRLGVGPLLTYEVHLDGLRRMDPARFWHEMVGVSQKAKYVCFGRGPEIDTQVLEQIADRVIRGELQLDPSDLDCRLEIRCSDGAMKVPAALLRHQSEAYGSRSYMQTTEQEILLEGVSIKEFQLFFGMWLAQTSPRRIPMPAAERVQCLCVQGKGAGGHYDRALHSGLWASWLHLADRLLIPGVYQAADRYFRDAQDLYCHMPLEAAAVNKAELLLRCTGYGLNQLKNALTRSLVSDRLRLVQTLQGVNQWHEPERYDAIRQGQERVLEALLIAGDPGILASLIAAPTAAWLEQLRRGPQQEISRRLLVILPQIELPLWKAVLEREQIKLDQRDRLEQFVLRVDRALSLLPPAQRDEWRKQLNSLPVRTLRMQDAPRHAAQVLARFRRSYTGIREFVADAPMDESFDPIDHRIQVERLVVAEIYTDRQLEALCQFVQPSTVRLSAFGLPEAPEPHDWRRGPIQKDGSVEAWTRCMAPFAHCPNLQLMPTGGETLDALEQLENIQTQTLRVIVDPEVGLEATLKSSLQEREIAGVLRCTESIEEVIIQAADLLDRSSLRDLVERFRGYANLKRLRLVCGLKEDALSDLGRLDQLPGLRELSILRLFGDLHHLAIQSLPRRIYLNTEQDT